MMKTKITLKIKAKDGKEVYRLEREYKTSVNICRDNHDSDVPDPNWTVYICSASWALLTISGLNLSNKEVGGKIKDSNGNEYNLTNVSYNITCDSGSAPTIMGDYCYDCTVTFTGKITPQNDICMYEIAFWVNGTLGNTSTTWLAIDLKNDSGSGSGVTLKAGNEYTIEVTEEISCPDTASVPAPDGTC